MRLTPDAKHVMGIYYSAHRRVIIKSGVRLLESGFRV